MERRTSGAASEKKEESFPFSLSVIPARPAPFPCPLDNAKIFLPQEWI